MRLHAFFVLTGYFILLGLMSPVAYAQAPEVASSYFQQEVNHQIEVALDDVNHALLGHIKTTYINNSPDTLESIWIHLWPNAYANGQTALAQQQIRQNDLFMFWAMQRDLGGMDSLDFRIDGDPVTWSFHPEHLDIALMELPSQLLPGNSFTYETPFYVKLPSGRISRLGHIGESYQITQWYPKPAVYDRDGWHEMPYLNQGEFYSEFGSFDVRITLPSNYVVGATGDLDPVWPDNHREKLFMDSLALACSRKGASTVFESEMVIDSLDDFPPSSPVQKTLRFRQHHVHDFAWFADKRWWVLKDEVELPWTKRKVTTWAMFTPGQAELWRKAPEYLADAVHYYSKWNGDYPYEHVTAVDGTISAGGGMEYPNVTVIGTSGSAMGLETVIVHEVGHNWFYGILGSNERTHAWMDEGINSFNETRYFVEKYGEELGFMGMKKSATPMMERFDLLGKSYQSRDVLAYLMSAKMSVDQPMQCHSDEFTSANYGTIVYKKTAAAFEYLKAYLGTPMFDITMQRYFSEWKFKHPAPSDLQKVFEKSTDQNLDWFFESLIQTTGQTDYALVAVKKTQEDSLRVRVVNRGQLAGPWSLYGQRQDSGWVQLGWYDGIANGEKVEVIVPSSNSSDNHYRALKIDEPGVMLDVNMHNNSVRTAGLFKGMEPLSLNLITRLDDGDQTQLHFLPFAGWNAADGWLPGLALHNSVLPLRDLEWLVAPTWSTARGTLRGMARLSWKQGPWRVEGQWRTFGSDSVEDFYSADYSRTGLKLMRSYNKRPSVPLRSFATVEWIDNRNRVDYDLQLIDPLFAPIKTDIFQAIRLNYQVDQRKRTISQACRVRFTWGGQASNWYNENWLASFKSPGLFPDMEQTSLTTELIWTGSKLLNSRDKKLEWRMYAGIQSGEGEVYRLMSRGIDGRNDVLHDHYFLSRLQHQSLSQVLAYEQGGMAWLHHEDDSENESMRSLFSMKVSRDLFAGLQGYAGVMWNENWRAAGAGLEWKLPFAKVQLPLISTDGDGEWMAVWNAPQPVLMVTLNLEQLSPYQLLRDGGARLN